MTATDVFFFIASMIFGACVVGIISLIKVYIANTRLDRQLKKIPYGNTRVKRMSAILSEKPYNCSSGEYSFPFGESHTISTDCNISSDCSSSTD